MGHDRTLLNVTDLRAVAKWLVQNEPAAAPEVAAMPIKGRGVDAASSGPDKVTEEPAATADKPSTDGTNSSMAVPVTSGRRRRSAKPRSDVLSI